MKHIQKRQLGRTLGCLIALCAATSMVHAEQKNGSGPTNEQIYCQNRAVNDYYANVQSCEQNLSDIPDQLALCKSDARATLDRAKASCVASRTKGSVMQNRATSGGLLRK